MAMSKKMLEQEPSEIEMLLPFHAAGTLSARDSRRVDEALARDPELARQYAVMQEEYAETIHLNETLGAPSARAMQKLFAAIDAEPPRYPSSPTLLSRLTAFFAGLSPRTLAWSASLAALALLLQAGLIGAVLVKNQGSTFETASLNPNQSTVRDLGPRALVRFTPEATVAEINSLLDSYQATIVEAKSGMFRLQFGNRAMTQDEVAGLMTKLQREKIVGLAVPAP